MVKGRTDKSAPPGATPQSTALESGEECGGKGGVPYEVFATGSDPLTRITVWHREYVDGLQLETRQGPLPRIGGTGKHRDIRCDSFELAPDEVLTGISVEYWNCIDRLTFHTSKTSHGPFGGQGGQVKRTLSAPAGRVIVGFKGRHWEFIDSIQLIVR